MVIMMDSSARIDAYKRILQEIKLVAKEKNLSRSDNALIKNLLTVLQFECEFKLLSQCYSNSTEFNKVVPDMETIYENYKKELDLLEQKKQRNEFAGMDAFRYKRLYKATARLERIIEMVKNREFHHYMTAMVATLNESDEIIEVCGSILKDGITDFSRLFGKDAVSSNEDGHKEVDDDFIDTIYVLLSHTETIKSAELYLRSYRLLHLDELKNNREINARFREYLIIIQNNLDLFREYMKLIHYSTKKSHDELSSYEAKAASLELEIHSARNILRKNNYQVELDKLNESIKNYKANIARVAQLEEQISMLGCEDLIHALDTSVRDLDNTAEAKVVSMLRPLSNNSFDMSGFIKTVSEGIKQEDEDINARQKSLDTKLESIHNPILRSALINYPEDVQVLLRMRNPHYGATEEQEAIGISPYLAALCLKAIKDAKNLTCEEIEQACESYNKAGVFARIEADNGIVLNCLSSINNLVGEVVKRVPYDPSDYGKLAIL